MYTFRGETMSFAFMPVLPVREARRIWRAALAGAVPGETVRAGLGQALGLVLASEVVAADDVPGFQRSTVDGYAVRAADTFGASESLPAYLEVAGETAVGRRPAAALAEGTAVRIATGAMLPDGADAAVMIEHCEEAGPAEVAVARPAAPGENVIARGEDVRSGELLLPAGHRLRPQDLGILAAAGVGSVGVHRRPRVAIVSTGDELVPPEATPAPGQVRDVNSYTLAGMVAAVGGEPVSTGIVADDPDAIGRRLAAALDAAEMLLVSGGSSVGTRDYVAAAIQGLGEPGILVHGVALRPGKPTVLAVARGRPVIGLPGHPASALVVFWLFGREALARAAGLPAPPAGAPVPEPSIRARLLRHVPSVAGREDYVRCAVAWDEEAAGWIAEPVFGPSGLISTLVRGEGLVRVPEESTGLEAGQAVEVFPFGKVGL